MHLVSISTNSSLSVMVVIFYQLESVGPLKCYQNNKITEVFIVRLFHLICTPHYEDHCFIPAHKNLIFILTDVVADFSPMNFVVQLNYFTVSCLGIMD